MMALLISLLAGVALVAVDQITKYAAVAHLKGQAPIEVWTNVFELQYCENTGVAFSLLENKQWVFIPMTLLVMTLVLVILIRSKLCHDLLFRSSCVLILAGGVGNLIDRVRLNYVVDFLYFKLIDFPIFNFADCCVVIGAILLLVYLLFIYKDTEETTLFSLLFCINQREKEPKDG